MSRYVPAAEKTPVEREAYNLAAAERNRRYYYRKKHGIEYRKITCSHDGCNEVIEVCGFCRAGLCEHD